MVSLLQPGTTLSFSYFSIIKDKLDIRIGDIRHSKESTNDPVIATKELLGNAFLS